MTRSIGTMVLHDDPPGQLALDAGPLIGLLNRRDRYREESLRGFQRLDRRRTRFLVALPILFEVFKWLLFHTDLGTARTGLSMMLERVDVTYPDADSLGEVVALVHARPRWPGSLEDAAVAQLALRRDVPVW